MFGIVLQMPYTVLVSLKNFYLLQEIGGLVSNNGFKPLQCVPGEIRNAFFIYCRYPKRPAFWKL